MTFKIDITATGRPRISPGSAHNKI